MRLSDRLHSIAQHFSPHRLTIARELRALKKIDLAALVGKSAGALSQFESGTTRPDAETVARLSLALELPAEFFGRPLPNVVRLEDCHFRSLRSARQLERRRVRARASLVCEVVQYLEQHIAFPAEHVSDIVRKLGHGTSPEDASEYVRAAWGLGHGPIPNVVRLLESRGIVVSQLPDQSREVDAFSVWHGGQPLIFLVSKPSTSRLRMDAAHELGHLVLHADVSPGDKETEKEAEHFGGAFLMPRHAFAREAPRRLNWPHLHELKRRWRVSLAALVRRAYELGCLSNASYRRAFMYLNKTGQRKSEPLEPPAEQPSVVARAISLIAKDRPPSLMATDLGLTEDDLLALVGNANGE